MTKIEIQNWDNVPLTKIFDMHNTHSITQRDLEPDSGTTPYVTAQSGNNGVLMYVSCPDEWKDKGPCIMIGGKTMTVTYQETDFCSNDSHNIALYTKEEKGKNLFCQLFLVSAIKKSLSSHYSWGDSVAMKRLKKDCIMVPVIVDPITKEKEIDWDYIIKIMSTAYQKEVPFAEKIAKIINCETIEKDQKTSIDIKKWRKFHLYDDELFTIDMGTKLDKIKMSYKSPTVNFVGRANVNNGITARVDRIEKISPYDAGNMTLSLGGEYLGSCFIQPELFYTSQNVVVLIPQWNMPLEVKLFLSCVIFRESRQYYKAFVDELNRHIKTDFSFYLPVRDDNSPDWDYMCQYMKKILKDVEEPAEELFRLT